MKNYVVKLANAIESKLNLSSKEIKEMSNNEFREKLRNGFFAKKGYTKKQTEPTTKQMDVLNLHYGKPITVTSHAIYNPKRFYFKSKKTGRRTYPKYIRKNKAGRLIDARTGKFIAKKK